MVTGTKKDWKKSGKR